MLLVSRAQALLSVQRNKELLRGTVAVIQIGINDLNAIGVMRGKKGEMVANLIDNIRDMVELLRKQNIPVLLTTVIPARAFEFLRRVVWPSEIDHAIDTANDKIRPLEKTGVEIIDCDPLLALDGRIKPEFSTGALHLSDSGYAASGWLIGQRLTSIMAMDAG